MKKVFILIALLSFLFVIAAEAQVTITAKKVTYTRRKPMEDYKKKFTVAYPKIKASTPAISKKIEGVLSYEKIFAFKLSEEMGEMQWLEDASYDVNYNQNKLLSIALTIEGSGAYPSSSTKHVVVNTATGTRVRPTDVFTNTGALIKKLIKMKDDEVAKTKERIKNDPETKDDDVSSLFTAAEEFHKVALDEFEIDANGVTFNHDYGFPHVALALQPPGQFFLTWKELKPYIKPGGLLSTFSR